MPYQKIATLISGGLDSATLIASGADQGYDQLAFFVHYGQDNFDREFACARINTRKFGVPLEVVDIRSLRDSFVGRFPFPINLYDCRVSNPLGQITTFAMSALVAGVSVLADRPTLMIGVHHTDMELHPVLQRSMARSKTSLTTWSSPAPTIRISSCCCLSPTPSARR